MWVIKKLRKLIPEAPFEVLIDGKPMGTTKLLAFARHVPNTDRFPQVLALYSSGYLRLKAGDDPTPPLPFGQSIVLGPAISGTSTSFSKKTLFFHPQIQRVAINTSQINKDARRLSENSNEKISSLNFFPFNFHDTTVNRPVET